MAILSSVLSTPHHHHSLKSESASCLGWIDTLQVPVRLSRPRPRKRPRQRSKRPLGVPATHRFPLFRNRSTTTPSSGCRMTSRLQSSSGATRKPRSPRTRTVQGVRPRRSRQWPRRTRCWVMRRNVPPVRDVVIRSEPQAQHTWVGGERQRERGGARLWLVVGDHVRVCPACGWCVLCLTDDVGDDIPREVQQHDGQEGPSHATKIERHYFPERFGFDLFGDPYEHKRE